MACPGSKGPSSPSSLLVARGMGAEECWMRSQGRSLRRGCGNWVRVRGGKGMEEPSVADLLWKGSEGCSSLQTCWSLWDSSPSWPGPTRVSETKKAFIQGEGILH